eukprot:NODE_585_length_5683_cov_0.592586.p4 type:complete len:247 gc:universal NODE_585_length_5683_cov_0.592586:3968-3228(-)
MHYLQKMPLFKRMIRINQQTIASALSNNVRLDGRSLSSYRNIQIQQDANGTLVKLGNTMIYCSSELIYTRIERQRINLQCPLKERWITNVIEKCVDLESLMVTRSIGFELNLQLIPLQNDGNELDAYIIGILAQLLQIKKQHVDENHKLIPANIRNPTLLQLLFDPISITICYINDKIVIDPLKEEELLADGIYSIIVNEHDEICSFVPLKMMKMDPEQVEMMMRLAVEKSKDLRKFVRFHVRKNK